MLVYAFMPVRTVLKQMPAMAIQPMGSLKRPRWNSPLLNVFLLRVTLHAIGMPASHNKFNHKLRGC